MEHLPPGPYDLAECDDGPDPTYEPRWRVVFEEAYDYSGVWAEFDREEPFDTEIEATLRAEQWNDDAECDDVYQCRARVEEYEVAIYPESYDMDDWDE